MPLLTLHPVTRSRNFQGADRIVKYDVLGIPTGERIVILETESRDRWHIFRNDDFSGDFASAANASASIQSEFEK